MLSIVSEYNVREVISIKSYFIKEDDKPNFLKETLNICNVKNNRITIPQINSNITEYQASKLAKNIRKKCLKQQINKVVLSKKIKKNTLLSNKIYENNINIFNGKWLQKYLVNETLDYIICNNNMKKEKTELAILSNYISKDVVEAIKLLSNEYKFINIITKQLNEYEKIANRLYDKLGLTILVSDNKRKSLTKSNIILNYDFSEKQLNNYTIFEKAIIVNLKEQTQITSKRFNGTIVNDYEIYSTRADDYFGLDTVRNFYIKDLLEESLYSRKDSYENIRRSITYGHYKIKNLYGVRENSLFN